METNPKWMFFSAESGTDEDELTFEHDITFDHDDKPSWKEKLKRSCSSKNKERIKNANAFCRKRRQARSIAIQARRKRTSHREMIRSLNYEYRMECHENCVVARVIYELVATMIERRLKEPRPRWQLILWTQMKRVVVYLSFVMRRSRWVLCIQMERKVVYLHHFLQSLQSDS